MAKISVVINTYNEEKKIGRCLASLKGFANEIIVVDMMSTDRTRELAKSTMQKYLNTKKLAMLNLLETLQSKKPKMIGFSY